jgi:hypothetical protein
MEASMAAILCDEVSKGLRASEVVAMVRDTSGRRHYLRVERDFLSEDGTGKYYLPVRVVDFDSSAKAVLVEFPQEAETGANRIWVQPSAFLRPLEAPL